MDWGKERKQHTQLTTYDNLQQFQLGEKHNNKLTQVRLKHNNLKLNSLE